MSAHQVRLNAGGRTVVVTEADGEAMRRALVDALSRSPDPELQKEARALAHAVPSIADDELRIDAWLLVSRESELLLLLYERRSPTLMTIRVAHLDGRPGGPWRVVQTTMETLQLER